MSLLLGGHSPKLFIRKPVLARACAGGSFSLVQTPPCFVISADPYGAGRRLLVHYAYFMENRPLLIKQVPVELVYNNEAVTTIGSSHGWVASLMHDVGTLRLHDDLNPVESIKPKLISLPPLVTLPHCQTQIITNVSLSSLSPEEEDCVVTVKFMGPQLSYCRPSAAQGNSKWFNIRIANPSFFSSSVMFSKKHNKFCIPGAGGKLIASWDLCKDEHTPKIQVLRYHNLPELSVAEREVMDTCLTTQHLVESQSTGETFLVKCFRQTVDGGGTSLKPKAVMVFKVSANGDAFYTRDIGDLTIFISKSEPFCVRASCFLGVRPNEVYILDADEISFFKLDNSTISTSSERVGVVFPYFFPPQNIEY
ncbi:unnamed protein product [Eruca vesicaria subsp. sativa]|uniref:KIB1-4 beta-propeller domain-containing protein n=1 Tax=Eruca vesicaria subsp. sativa TaxID=29727 RepID=A0ABC8KXA2_ERUVS|nr:unnamed protein product [Eruca vesicaria subsp. sativa]